MNREENQSKCKGVNLFLWINISVNLHTGDALGKHSTTPKCFCCSALKCFEIPPKKRVATPAKMPPNFLSPYPKYYFTIHPHKFVPLHSHFPHLTSKKFAIPIPRKCLPPQSNFFVALLLKKKIATPSKIFSYITLPRIFCHSPLKILWIHSFINLACPQFFCHSVIIYFAIPLH